jgi:hypothetical protein
LRAGQSNRGASFGCGAGSCSRDRMPGGWMGPGQEGREARMASCRGRRKNGANGLVVRPSSKGATPSETADKKRSDGGWGMVDGFTKKGERRGERRRVDGQRTRTAPEAKKVDRDGNLEIDANGPFPPCPTRTLFRLQRPGRLVASTDLAACQRILCIGRGARSWHRRALTGRV